MKGLRQTMPSKRIKHRQKRVPKPGRIRPHRGRPTRYSAPVGKAICKMLADGGWALDPQHPFSPQYNQARLVAYHGLGDELLEIADDSSKDVVERQSKDGSTNTVIDHDNIARARLRIDTRKWFLSKMLPKIYGDKLDASISKDGAPPQLGGPRPAVEDHLAEVLGKRFGDGLKKYQDDFARASNGR